MTYNHCLWQIELLLYRGSSFIICLHPQPAMPPSLNDRFTSFAKRTTFHGFQELHDSATWWQKCIWVLAICICTAMLIVFVFLQVGRYVGGPTATRVSRLEEIAGHQFPPIFVLDTKCSWIDMAKVKQFEITSEELQVALSYSGRGILTYNSSVQLEEAKQRLRARMDKLGVSQVLQFYHLIMLETYDGAENDGHVVQKGLARDEGYYLINTTGVTKTDLAEAWLLHFSRNVSKYEDNLAEVLSFMHEWVDEDTVKAVPPVLFNMDTFTTVGIKAGFTYKINTESTIFKRLGACTKEYPLDDLYYPKACQLDCELRANASLRAATCIKYSSDDKLVVTDSFRLGNVTLCHPGVFNPATGQLEGMEEPVYRLLTKQEEEQRDRTVAKCQKKCIPRCEEWSTTWNVYSNQYRENSEVAFVQIVFPTANRLLVIEEVAQYEWNDLVSDFGGLLGLWLGASMMSLFQLFHLCLLPPAKNK